MSERTEPQRDLQCGDNPNPPDCISNECAYEAHDVWDEALIWDGHLAYCGVCAACGFRDTVVTEPGNCKDIGPTLVLERVHRKAHDG